MGDLRFRINSENIDVEKLWESLGFESKKKLNFEEFHGFLMAIDPDMNEAEAVYFF